MRYIKNKRSLFFLFSLLFGLKASVYRAQDNKDKFVIDGLVTGYNHDSSRKLFQKEKPVVLEGVLDKVLINISDNGQQVTSAYTNKKGEFDLKLDIGKMYRADISKSNHAKIILLIDLRAIPPDVAERGLRFNSTELILNSFLSEDTSQNNLPFGRLYYDARRKMMDFEPSQVKNKSGIFSWTDESNIPISLMKRSVLKNKDNVMYDEKNVSIHPSEPANKITKKAALPVKPSDNELVKVRQTDSLGNSYSDFHLSPNSGIERLTGNSLVTREFEIAQARKQLEEARQHATNKLDSLIIRDREELLNAASHELEDAKKLIALQKNHITIQNNLLFTAISSVVLLFALLFIIYRNYSGKKKINKLLEEKNKKITDSITYAKHIQESILPSQEEIERILPDSFIYYQPRDIVSGDFYWIAELDGKTIIAAVDCTGHGVPGAFMALIGNTLLNEIINDKRIIQPSLILKFLHEGVLKLLHQDSGELYCQDGMEMTLCVIDYKKKTIDFAGAMNPVYVIRNSAIEIIKPDVQSIGGMGSVQNPKNKNEFTNQTIPIEKGMLLYMFTDGYLDQFGGPENKKFNTARFKALLMKIHVLSIKEQQQAIEQTINDWKGNYRQIDDMLVIGIRF